MIFKGWQNNAYWGHEIHIKKRDYDGHNKHIIYGVFILGFFIGIMRHTGKYK